MKLLSACLVATATLSSVAEPISGGKLEKPAPKAPTKYDEAVSEELVEDKGFADSAAIPREPMVFICSDCHPCLYPIETTYHIESEHDCEQACYFNSQCRYTAYNPRAQECNQYDKCVKDKHGELEYTRMHKRDAGVLSDLYLSSSCTLSPAFQPMVFNYMGDCPSTAVAASVFKSKNDLWVNNAQIFRSEKGYVTIPSELYHDTPTVLSIQTLKDLEISDVEAGDLQTCSEHHHCQAGYWDPHRKCAGGFCRSVAETYTIALQDSAVADYDQATVDSSYGGLSRETIVLKPPDAQDYIANYAQVMQDYAGPDYEKKVLATVHNNKPLQPVCQHCNKICDKGSDEEWFLRSEWALGRMECIESCYRDRDCVAVNINLDEGICDLFKTCHEKDMLLIAKTDAGTLLDVEKHPITGAISKHILGPLGVAAVKRQLAEEKDEEEDDEAEDDKVDEESEKDAAKKDDKPPAGTEDKTRAKRAEDAKKIEEAEKKEKKILKGQKIKDKKTGKEEVLEVPEEFRVPKGVLTEFMVFRRPELDIETYVAPDKHLLDFGGTEYGTVDLVGQSAVQDCVLNAHAGSGTSDKTKKYLKVTCTRDTHEVSLYVTGRGITPANFKCSKPLCGNKFNATECAKIDESSGVTTMIDAMASVDTLGTMRDSVNVVNEFSASGHKESVLINCESQNFEKTKKFDLALDIEFAAHDDFGTVIKEIMRENNDVENEIFKVGYAPKCRYENLRNVFYDYKQKCEQVPAHWDAEKHPKLRFICPLKESSTVDMNMVVSDASAKVMFNGALLRNLKSIVGSDAAHGGSEFGGVDFYYPIKNLEIKGDNADGVQSWKLNTFCEEKGRAYDIILQNGWDMKPVVTQLKISTGDNCKMSPPKYHPNVTDYTVECPQTTEYIGITPLLKDVGTRMLVNGDVFPANEEIPPVQLEAGDSHVWNIVMKAPIDPDTEQPVYGYDANEEIRLKVTGVRFAPWGLGQAATEMIASVCSTAGLGLAIVSASNFMGVAKFLQFLGILVAVHGTPDAFKTFCASFSKVNLQFNHLDDYLPAINVKKYMPFDIKKFQKMAAQAAGLPFRALKVMQHHAETAVLKAHLKLSGKADSEKAKSAAAAAKREAEQLAEIRRKYRKQYIRFKQNFAKLKKSFSENKGTLFNLFLIPIGLSALMLFYVVRYTLRLAIPEGFYGYDWDQARNEQMKPNFILLFICDLGLIGFVKAASKIYCEGSTIELYLPDAHDHWGFWKPPREAMNHVCLALFFLYPVAFLYFTARELAKNQRQVIYNKALKAYADKEGCLEIRASQNEPFPVPVLGQMASKVNFAMSTNIKSVSPILWAKNAKGEYIYDKTKKTHWVLGLGTMLEGRVKPNSLELTKEHDNPLSATGKQQGDVYYQWDSVKVGKVEDTEKCPLRENDVILRIGSRDDFEIDNMGLEKTDSAGRRVIRMREIPYISLSALEEEMSDRCWVEVRRAGSVQKFQLPPAKVTTGFDVCSAKLTGACKGGAKGGLAALASGNLSLGDEPVSATSAVKLPFVHTSVDGKSGEVLSAPVDRDYEVRVFVGANKNGFQFESKTIPTRAGEQKLSRKPVARSDAQAGAVTDPSMMMMSHVTDSLSWQKNVLDGSMQSTEPAEMSAVWNEREDTHLGQYLYNINAGGKSLRTDIVMDYTMVKQKESADDMMSQLKDAKGMCCGADGLAGKPPEFDHQDMQYFQRIYSEEAKFASHTCLTGMGIGKQPLRAEFDRNSPDCPDKSQIQEETDSKDLDNVDNPWYRDAAYDTKFCRKVLQCGIPEKLSLENADGQRILANLNHVTKVVIRGAGMCSKQMSEVFLVLRQASRSLKVNFAVTGRSYYAMTGPAAGPTIYARSLLSKLKENPTPGQQAMERTITALTNHQWEHTKPFGGQPITDQFVSIEKWKVNPGNPFSDAKLLVTVDVDLDKSGFTEQGNDENGVYDEQTKNLCAHVLKAFDEGGKGFLTAFLRDLSELMGDNITAEEKAAFGNEEEVFVDTKNAKQFAVYLDSVKEKSSLGKLKKRLTQIKFEDDFDHPCLNQAMGRDTLEVWICGPCYNGTEANFKFATASITCEKDAARSKEQFAEVKLHSDVFCGRDGISVEESDVLSSSIGFLSADGGASLSKKPSKTTMGHYKGVVQTDMDETTPATKAQIMEQTSLHKGLSPEGVPYRLSDAFARFPNAYVGRKRFQLSVLGDFNYEMAGRIENRHIPVLHYFTPGYQLEVPTKHLVFPRRDYYNHFYSQMKENQRWNFLISRIITLVSILGVIYFGQAKAAFSSELNAGKASLSHLTASEKKAAVAAAKKASETSAGFTQLIALLAGTFVTFATAAYPDIMQAYGEKEEERLNELKDAGLKESPRLCGLVAAYDKLMWYSQKQHRNFALEAVFEGASFMYAAEVMLIIILIFGHEGSPFVVKIPMSLDAWMLILVTGYTLVKLNAEFLAAQKDKALKKLSEADDRILAEYEAKMKLYTEKKKQVLDFFDLNKWKAKFRSQKAKYQDKIDAINEKIQAAFASAEKLRQMAEARAKAAEEAEKKKREQGLVEEGETDDELETAFVGKVNESPAKKPLLDKGEIEMTAFGGGAEVAGKGGIAPMPSARREPAPPGSPQAGNMGNLTARTVEKLAAAEKTKWDEWHVAKDTDKIDIKSAAPAEEVLESVHKKSGIVVIPGAKALTELQAVTGLSQQGPFALLGRTFRALMRCLLYPFTELMPRSMLSNLICKVLAPAFAGATCFYAVVSANSTSGMLFMLLLFLFITAKIHDFGKRCATESAAELEEKKLAQKAAAMQEAAAADAKKVTSIHMVSVLKADAAKSFTVKEHVESALEATETVDAAWAKGEHTFTRMPPAMVKTQKRVVPDVNRGWFELNPKHFAPGKQPDAEEIGTTLNSDEMFTSKDYVFDTCDIIVDSLGLRLPSDVKPIRHDKTLSKKLLQVNKPLGTTRDLVKSFPIQITVDSLKGESKQENKQTQVACTLQIVNFVGKGEADRPDNDSYLTLTDVKAVGGKKGAGPSIDTYKVGDEIVFNDLKKGDLCEIVLEDDEERVRAPKLASQSAWQKASNGEPLTEADISYEEQAPPEPAFEGAHNSSPPPLLAVEGDHSLAPGSPKAVGRMSSMSSEAAVDMDITKWKKPALLDLRPDDATMSGEGATLYEIENTYGNFAHIPKELRGTPMPQNAVRFKVKTESGERYSFCPVKPGAGQGLLCRQEGELSLEEQKARKCAEWFGAVMGWLGDLGASENLRSNVHNVYDELFWGKDTTTTGGRPKDTDGQRKAFKKNERKDLPAQQKGLLARVLDQKDKGVTVKEYFDFLMYGHEEDNEWPGFIYWFRFKAKGDKLPEQLNKNPKFRECPVVTPGPIVAALSKPALAPQVLHVVLTDADLRAPGDVVDAWQPQRGEPHTAEMFKLNKEGFSKGNVGLLKLLPDKLQFENPVGDGTVDADAMADTVNFDFSDTYAMFPVKHDTYKTNPRTGVEELAVTGRTLYLQMKSGDIVAFGMDQQKIDMWADLIEKYQMSVPQQFILGYDGEVTEHPEDPNLQIREGKQGYQKFYMKSNCTSGYVPKSRYCGSWKNHKYHGDGVFYKLQVSEKVPHKALYPGTSVGDKNPLGYRFKDVNLVNDREHLHHARANFERQVVMYDGNFANGLRDGKGIAFFNIPLPDGKKLLYRFNGLWCKDRPVLGELMLVDGEITEGSPVMKYYFGTVLPLNSGKKTGDGKADEFLKNRLMDISPFEVFAAASLSCGANSMSPAQVVYQLKRDYASLLSVKSKKLEEQSLLLEQLNAKIAETKNTYGYYDEPLNEFDVYVLSRLLEPLKKMPMVRNLMEADPSGYFRDGLNANDYKFIQKINVRDFHADEYIRDDLERLYAQWFKYECYNDEVLNTEKQGTIYAIDGGETSKWESYKKGLASLAEDWRQYKKEIPYEDATMLMEMGRKKKPKWMGSAQQKQFCEDLLLQCLPAESEAPAWYSQVSGEVFGEEHGEMKEMFRSWSRKLSAIFPTAPLFGDELWGKMPAAAKKITEAKLEGTFESGSDLDLPTSFTKYMGRLLQVNGVVDDAGLVAQFQDDLLGLFNAEKDPWTEGKLFDSLKDTKTLNGFMAMRSVDKDKKPVDFAAPMVNGLASGKNAYVATNEFSYSGDYVDGKFEGTGTLNVKEAGMKSGKFKGLESYEGEWKAGMKDGKARMVHVSAAGDRSTVDGQFAKGKLSSVNSVECVGANVKDGYKLVKKGGKTVLVFNIDGAGEVEYTVAAGDAGKLKEKVLDLNGNIDLKGKDCAVRGSVSKHQLNGKGYVEGASGKYDGNYSGNKRSGDGVWTFGPEAVYQEDGKTSGNYKGTTVTCDAVKGGGKFENDKPTGRFKVDIVKDGKRMGTVNYQVLPGQKKATVAMFACPPGCCAAPLPDGMLDEKFPPTQALPFGSRGGIPLEFNDVEIKVEYPAVTPWGEALKF